jgi:p-aminobenzoyl-glutamate transporter AbgT
MDDDQKQADQKQQDDRAEVRKAENRERMITNIVLLLIFAVLVGIGVWISNAMLDARRADECISSGRRNCAPIEVPPR